MLELLKAYENKDPEIVFEWNDRETDARGWIVINSLRGNAAGGGTRMRKGLNKNEVVSLAKTMEIKFTCSGPPIGGAKSGIDFDPEDPRKEEVLRRWYKAVLPLLKSYYGTGGDMNVDEVLEVIPITGELGLQHPQEGVLSGHFNPEPAEKKAKIAQLQEGVSKIVTDTSLTPDQTRNYVVADLITGYGVSESVKHFYDIYGGSLKSKKVIIQGWGNVASAAAYYLASEGAVITGIIDRNGGLIDENGLSFDQVRNLFLNKKGNQLNADNLLSFDAVNRIIWDTPADVFIPAAGSRLLTQEQLDRMLKAGLKVISAGANVPFADKEIFFGPIAAYADKNCSVIPDFIANAGMARTFAYLMQSGIQLTDKAIFEDVSKSIYFALENCYKRRNETDKLMETGFTLALEKVM